MTRRVMCKTQTRNLKKGEPLYQDVSNTRKELTSVNSDGRDSNEKVHDYTLFEPVKAQSSDAVQGARIVTALFDFNQFSEDEISFKERDKLKLRGETLSDFTDNCDWCLAEHLTTGKKGYIPLVYVTENIHALKAQSWWFDISRKEASRLLTMSGSTPGTYLVRPTESARGHITLSLLNTDSNVTHCRIISKNGRLYVGQRRWFNNIFELINFYKYNVAELRCKLESPAQKQNPFVYSRNLEVKRRSVVITKSFRCGNYGEIFIGKFSNTLDVTIVTKFKLTVDKFLAEAKVLHNFRQCKRFVRVLAVIINPEPFMLILGETVRNTLQQCLQIDGGKTFTRMTLLEIAAEIAEGMAFLEKEKVVHRHLKAENVFVCDFYKVKIVHPKLSEMMKVRFSDEHCEDENDWQWTAPEAIDDKTMFSTKSDVWSFGILLYELITFGKTPYAGLIKKDTLSRLQKGFRLPKPKDGPVPCHVAFYVTMLKCWHQLPECRPTFDFLQDFFHDFEVAIEYEIGLEEIRLDSQKSEPQESTPITSESIQNVGITEPNAENYNNGKTRVDVGVSVKELYDYDAETRHDPQKSGPQESTSESLENVGITDPTAENNNNGKTQVDVGVSVKELYDYDTETRLDLQKSGPQESTSESLENVGITDPTAENNNNGKTQVDVGVSVKELYDYDAETRLDPQKSGPQESTSESLENVGITDPTADNNNNGKTQVDVGVSVKELYDYDAETRLDPQKSGPQESTSESLENVGITDQTAENNNNGKTQVTGGDSVKEIIDYDAETQLDPQKYVPKESTPNVGITESNAETNNNGITHDTGGFRVKPLYDYDSETRLDPQKYVHKESTPITSECFQNVGITEPTTVNNNNGKTQDTGGFSVKVMYDYDAETRPDPQTSVPQESTPITSQSLQDTGITEPTVENNNNGQTQDTETRLDPQKPLSQESTPITSESFQNVGIREATVENNNNGKTQDTGGFSVKSLYNYDAETRLRPQKSVPQESAPITSESFQNVGITEPTAENNNNGKTQDTGGVSVKALYDDDAGAEGEASFYEDDIITDVDTVDEGWCIGTATNGTRGLFPSN
ncbi:tyrosine-protein kinase Abl-like [Mercenaria mercenaria]|uniref:tyrosine-protein kinase Abl-like n=1 Tax=Mercenaria mercenaria TaxID=6596 RepID=UPI00234EA394|nr:tyrosine-protein kinase Abl-like [Mercenaria mercenaria]